MSIFGMTQAEIMDAITASRANRRVAKAAQVATGGNFKSYVSKTYGPCVCGSSDLYCDRNNMIYCEACGRDIKDVS